MMSPGIFNLLDDIFSEDFVTPTRSFRRESTPAVNVKEDDKAFNIEMAVPGFEKKDIKIEVEEDVLNISSELKEEKKEEKDNFTRREFNYSSFKRSFNLPEDVEAGKIEAKQENGILSINIPKKEVIPALKKMIKIA